MTFCTLRVYTTLMTFRTITATLEENSADPQSDSFKLHHDPQSDTCFKLPAQYSNIALKL